MRVRPVLFGLLLLSARPALAQRPVAEMRSPAGGFWAVDYRGLVGFTGPAARPQVGPLAQAEHVRAWLTRTCGTSWQEQQTGQDSVQVYRGQLTGKHVGTILTFTLRLARQPGGWVYRLGSCQVGAPTGEGQVQWLPLHRVLGEVDFQADVQAFQRQLQGTLPSL